MWEAYFLELCETWLVLTRTSPGVSSFSEIALLFATRNFENML
jgi:hypothetical protein